MKKKIELINIIDFHDRFMFVTHTNTHTHDRAKEMNTKNI